MFPEQLSKFLSALTNENCAVGHSYIPKFFEHDSDGDGKLLV
jgi:hypothetical protein